MKYLDVELRDMTVEDIPQVMPIENTCFLHPYKEKDFYYEIEENPVSNIWVMEYTIKSTGIKQIVGFVDYWVTFDSGTIVQIAVHPDIQRSGIGSMMMKEVLKDAYVKKVRTLTLEVRESNKQAISFYEKHGFYISHKKPAYYSNGEDAIYMIKEVKEYHE